MYDLVNYDYAGRGCKHTAVEGFLCMAFADERTAVWMTGIDPDDGHCECFIPKERGCCRANTAYNAHDG